MNYEKEKEKQDYKLTATDEPEIYCDAVPAETGAAGQGPPVPEGHARFYCNKCHTVGP
jgi:hypothetical protein